MTVAKEITKIKIASAMIQISRNINESPYDAS